MSDLDRPDLLALGGAGKGEGENASQQLIWREKTAADLRILGATPAEIEEALMLYDRLVAGFDDHARREERMPTVAEATEIIEKATPAQVWEGIIVEAGSEDINCLTVYWPEPARELELE